MPQSGGDSTASPATERAMNSCTIKEPEPVAALLGLGGKERVEDVREDGGCNAAAGNGHPQLHAVRGREGPDRQGGAIAPGDGRGLDAQLAARGHSVAGVEREIEQYRLQEACGWCAP